MRVINWDIVLLLFLIIECRVHGYNISLCDKVISMRCNSYQINMLNMDTTSSLAPRLLEQCNGRERCEVNNPHNECIKAVYLCEKEVQNIDLAELSDYPLKSKDSIIHLMSANYTSGKYILAQKTACRLRPDDDGPHWMKVTVKEFAPFVNSTDYCLDVQGAVEPAHCSGSKKVYISYKPVRSTDGWQISMELAENATHVPKVRFWITIDVSPKNDVQYLLKCRSSPVETKDIHAEEKPFTQSRVTNTAVMTEVILPETKVTIYAMYFAMGSILCILVPVLTGLTIYCLRRPHRQPDMNEEIYYDGNIVYGAHISESDVSDDMAIMDNFIHGSQASAEDDMDVVDLIDNSIYCPQMAMDLDSRRIDTLEKCDTVMMKVIGNLENDESEDLKMIANAIYSSQITLLDKIFREKEDEHSFSDGSNSTETQLVKVTNDGIAETVINSEDRIHTLPGDNFDEVAECPPKRKLITNEDTDNSLEANDGNLESIKDLPQTDGSCQENLSVAIGTACVTYASSRCNAGAAVAALDNIGSNVPANSTTENEDNKSNELDDIKFQPSPEDVHTE